MTSPRRRVIRGSPAAEAERPNGRAVLHSERKLANERILFRRWLSKLKRSLRAVDKSLGQIARLEKTIAQLRQV